MLFCALLDLERDLAPLREKASHVLHAMVRVKQSSHRIEQVLVPVKVFFLLNQLKFETRPHRLVLQRVIVLDVVNQLFEKIVAIIDLEQCSVVLVRMDAGYLLMTVTDSMMLIVILRVKEIADGSLCFLFELEDLDNICFLPVAGAPLVVTSFLVLLVAVVKVVVCLAAVSGVVVALLLMPAREAVFIAPLASERDLQSFVFRSIRHNHLHSLQVFGRGTDALHELQVLTLHVFVSL